MRNISSGANPLRSNDFVDINVIPQMLTITIANALNNTLLLWSLPLLLIDLLMNNFRIVLQKYS